MIRAIDASSVDQITSGQVVTSLASALKELVENAVDSGATVVEVTVQNHGRDGFSVQDNGSGIAAEDFNNVAKRHATSKLSSVSELAFVRTLGFRGEALASLCALADVRITTNTGSGSGYELVFDAKGDVTSSTKVARPKGTLVAVNDIFRSVPVRRRDFERNFQREFTKAVALLQEYALLSPVRLTVEHSVKNRRSTILRSQGSQLLQRIACIYGASRTSKLLEVELTPESMGIECTVTGFISKPVFGMGLASLDRQLLAVNGRPSRQPKLVRTIVDVYKQFNLTESPFFVLDFRMDPARYDVNVSPDKRTLLLHDEARLVNGLRDALAAAFNLSGHSVPRSSLEVPPPKRQKQPTLSFAAFAGSGTVIQQSSRDASIEEEEVEQEEEDEERAAENDAELDDAEAESAHESADEPETTGPAEKSADVEMEEVDEGLDARSERQLEDSHTLSEVAAPSPRPLESQEDEGQAANEEAESETEMLAERPPAPDAQPQADSGDETKESIVRTTAGESPSPGAKRELKEHSCSSHHASSTTTSVPPRNASHGTMGESVSERLRPASQPRALNHHVHLPVSLEDVIRARQKEESRPQDMKKLQKLAIDEDGVEERLSLSIGKGDFAEMEIVGQFNLGFILVVNRKKNHDDLFVIDQHASDEIFNFERLQRSTVLSRQPLVVPHPLELSAVEELTVAENLDVFENNGFTIEVNPANPPGKQCALLSVPFSKNTVFDEKDVHDLLSKVQEDPENRQVRCSKLRAMLAMRACRSSIMIGKALSMATMTKVVRNLGTLERPWNCPHGRPTLRHITTLS